jgi:hypothetical protein
LASVGVVEPIGRYEVAAAVITVAQDRRIDIAERPDVLLPSLEAALAIERIGLDYLLTRIVVVLARAADDALGPPILAPSVSR